jgi:hypothetical protein
MVSPQPTHLLNRLPVPCCARTLSVRPQDSAPDDAPALEPREQQQLRADAQVSHSCA